MSNNCLVTKLKESVNNDNLHYLDGVVISITSEASPNYSHRNFLVRSTQELTNGIKVLSGDIYFTNSSGSANYGTTINLNQGSNDLYVSNGNGKILIKNKSKIDLINLPSNGVFNLDISQVDYMDFYNLVAPAQAEGVLPDHFTVSNALNLTGCAGVSGALNESMFLSSVKSVNVRETKLSGDISYILSFSSLTSINISFTDVKILTTGFAATNVTSFIATDDTNVYGNISDLANGKLTTMEIRNCSLTGSIEDYIEAEWLAGRRSENVSILTGNNCKFHNIANNNTTYYVAFEADLVTVKQTNSSGTTLGTYDGSDWTYA